MSQSMALPPKRISKASTLVGFVGLGALFVVVLTLPLLLLREQALLYAEIQYRGADSYPVVPVVPFPGPPTTEEVETFEIDGLRFSLPVGSVDYVTVGEELEGRLVVRLHDGRIVALDPPVRPTPMFGQIDSRIETYASSPAEFSWGASVEETRRLRRALSAKNSLMFADSATGMSHAVRPEWKAYALRSPSLNIMNWLSADESSTGLVWVHQPPTCNADGDALADLVFGSFEVVHPPRGTFDAEALRLADRFPKTALSESP